MFVSVGSARTSTTRIRRLRRRIGRCPRVQSGWLGDARLRLRHPQLRRDGDNSKTGELWCSVERTRRAGGRSGSGLHHPRAGGRLLWLALVVHGRTPGPAHQGKHPELKDKLSAGCILHPHNASLGITFYDGRQFPAEYHGDIFAADMDPGIGQFAWDMS